MIGRTASCVACSILFLALAGQARAAVTVGSDLTRAPNSPGVNCIAATSCTVAATNFPAANTNPASSSISGVVVRFNVRSASADTITFRIVRLQMGTSNATGAGTGPTLMTSGSGSQGVDTRLPIQAGDFVGFDEPNQPMPNIVHCGDGGAAAFYIPVLADGGSLQAPSFTSGCEYLVNAVVEPDGDGDGFGDETQDLCPTDVSTQGTCPPVITVPPPADLTAPNTALGSVTIKRAARKAKFRFSSNEPGSSFLCKIDKKPFTACTSPRTYKKLKRGKHKFRAQARDAAGNLDASPVVRKFRI